MCVRACVRACARACVRTPDQQTELSVLVRARACACVRVRACACVRVRACVCFEVGGGKIGGAEVKSGEWGGKAKVMSLRHAHLQFVCQHRRVLMLYRHVRSSHSLCLPNVPLAAGSPIRVRCLPTLKCTVLRTDVALYHEALTDDALSSLPLLDFHLPGCPACENRLAFLFTVKIMLHYNG